MDDTTGPPVVALRLYGDDAEDFKGQASMIYTWASQTCFLTSWLSRMLITVVPLADVVADATLKRVEELIAWSINVLLTGEWPPLNPYGEAWTDWRAKMAGPLDPRRRARAGLARIVGDWKWLKASFLLRQSWSTNLCCHLCGASKVDHPFMSDFREEAEWLATEKHLKST